MFVRPGRAAAGSVDDSKYRVGSHEIPGINRKTAVRRISRQLHRIDRTESTIREAGARCTSIEQGLIDLNAFLVFRGCALEDACRTGAMKKPAAGVRGRRRKRSIVGNIVESSMRFR